MDPGLGPPEATPPQVVIRRAAAVDEQRDLEDLVRVAFWNHFQPGADEHLLLHMLQSHPDHIPDLYLVATLPDSPRHAVACIAYSRSKVAHPHDGSETPTITFGPVAVHPAHQRRGIASALIMRSLEIATAEMPDVAACIIYGDPRFYGRLGFRCAERYDITNPDGFYVPCMMVHELREGSLRAGAFHESDAFRAISVEAAEAYDIARGAPPMVKGPSAMQADFRVLTSLKYKRR